MKTYQHENFQYYFDTNLKMWAVQKLNDDLTLSDEETYYFINKTELKKVHSEFKFIEKKEVALLKFQPVTSVISLIKF